VPEGEIEHLTVALGEPVQGSGHDQQSLSRVLLGLEIKDLEVPGSGVRDAGPLLKGVIANRGLGATRQLAEPMQFLQALPASDGVEPRTQPVRIP
jgi:hypothetical protein